MKTWPLPAWDEFLSGRPSLMRVDVKDGIKYFGWLPYFVKYLNALSNVETKIYVL
jgi:uncharacterized protein YqjF (DUF2071 family)